MLRLLVILPFALQGTFMLVDEFHFHRRRGLARWERAGHPLDTLTALACLGWLVTRSFSEEALAVYAALSLFSCLFVTKDELVHARACESQEHWLHGLLFVLHPLVFVAAAAIVWWPPLASLALIVRAQLVLMGLFFVYQTLYWNIIYDGKSLSSG